MCNVTKCEGQCVSLGTTTHKSWNGQTDIYDHESNYCNEHTCTEMLKDYYGVTTIRCRKRKAKSRDYCDEHDKDVKRCAENYCKVAIRSKNRNYCARHNPAVVGKELKAFKRVIARDEWFMSTCTLAFKGFNEDGKASTIENPNTNKFTIEGSATIVSEYGGNFEGRGDWKVAIDTEAETITIISSGQQNGRKVKLVNKKEFFEHINKQLGG